MVVLGERNSYSQRIMGPLLIAAVVLGLLGLPLAIWLDLRILSERMLRMQASEISRIVDDMRGFYGSDVVARVLEADGPVTVTHNYRDIKGAIPIPATLSIELGQRISAHDGSAKYRFVSDMTFKGRPPHQLDDFERNAIANLRAHPEQRIVDVSGSLFDQSVRTAAPVIMGPVCVSCHNTHPESPKTDWKVGDVRGIQEISVDAADLRERLLVQILAVVPHPRLARGPCHHHLAAAAGAAHQRHEPGADRRQRLPRRYFAEAREIPVAASLQEHLQRPEGCVHRHRTQEAHDLLLRHQGFHRAFPNGSSRRT